MRGAGPAFGIATRYKARAFPVPVDAAVAATVAVRDMVSAEVRRTRAERMPILSYEILVHGMPTLF